MTVVNANTVTIPSNPADREKIVKVFAEISNAFTRIEAEKEYIKDAIGQLVEDFEIPRRPLNKMAKMYHKQNYTEEKTSTEEIFDAYSVLVGEGG